MVVHKVRANTQQVFGLKNSQVSKHQVLLIVNGGDQLTMAVMQVVQVPARPHKSELTKTRRSSPLYCSTVTSCTVNVRESIAELVQ